MWTKILSKLLAFQSIKITDLHLLSYSTEDQNFKIHFKCITQESFHGLKVKSII